MNNFIVITLTAFCWLFIGNTTAQAGFNWGRGTYENYDDILIINSLGDSTIPSTFGNLGVNDFIEENGVKNYLALEGYSVANDYNPSITNSQFVNFYNDVPVGDYTKLTFAGLEGNPRKSQDVYVLTSEYNNLSSQGQSNSIDVIRKEQITQNTDIKNNTTRIETVNNDSISRDNALQDNINNVEKRIDKLEQTQGIIGIEARVYDSRKWTVTTFVDYTTTRNTMDRVGVRFTYKVGRSYEECRIDELERKLSKLDAINTDNGEIYTEGSTIGYHSKF